MAPSRSQPVKCLNTLSSSGKRFVFKTFSQRVEEIEIDVYRSLDPVKSEPSDGSSFFREELLQWRELNTTEHFISFYEEMLPWVQTLPQILLHKEKIFSELLCRVQMNAQLSLEPILRLIAALSRDILEEFLPFFPRLAGTLVDLLKDGGEREPEILEQVFTSWSLIMMHLQKYLTKDVVHILRITMHLRHYHKDYVQEFMAESISFLLRNTSVEQLEKGVRKVLLEAVKNPSPARKTGASALLWYTMRGTSSMLHSRADKILQLLFSKCMLGLGDKFIQGSDTAVEVATDVIQRLSEALPSKHLDLLWDRLSTEIYACIKDGCLLHMRRLLALLTFFVRFSSGGKIPDCHSILKLVNLLIETYIIPFANMEPEDQSHRVIAKILQLILCLLDSPVIQEDFPTILQQWAPIFHLKNSRLITFIRGLLLKDPAIPYIFQSHIMSAMDDLIGASPSEVLYVMMSFFEKLQQKLTSSSGLIWTFEDKLPNTCNFIKERICIWIELINKIATEGKQPNMPVCESELAILWGALHCYPHVFSTKADPPLIIKLLEALDKLLVTQADNIAGAATYTWQSLIGAALTAYHKVLMDNREELAETSNFLTRAKKYKSSSHVLAAVADYLISVSRLIGPTDDNLKSFHPQLGAEEAVDLISIFADNLALPDKAIRISTLKILSHHKFLDYQHCESDERAQKTQKTEGSPPCFENAQCSKVIEELISIEETPVALETSRKIVRLISKIQMDLAAGRIPEVYIPLLLNEIIGIFYNRFLHLWEPAIQCLTVLIRKYTRAVYDRFLQCLERHQTEFLFHHIQLESTKAEPPEPNTLGDLFHLFLVPDVDATPCATLFSLLLQSLQKIPDIAGSHSQQLIPLFFKFLGYSFDGTLRLELLKSNACKGKEWRLVLKEWLNLLRLMRHPQSLYGSQSLKDVLVNRLLDDSDPDVQMKVLDCLFNWKDDFLIPYEQHLRNLITLNNMREELTTWTLSRESRSIQNEHRAHVISLVIRILFPKIRKLRTQALRKHAGVHHRRAVLGFLADLDVDELPLLFSLLLKPFFAENFVTEKKECSFSNSSESFEGKFHSSFLVKCSTSRELSDISWKKRCGFLHVVEDILGTFDKLLMEPYINTLMTIVVRLLESSMLVLKKAKDSEPSVEGCSSGDPAVCASVSVSLNAANPNTAVKQLRELRSLCLKIIYFVLSKYDNQEFGSEFWDIFFASVRPLIENFKQDASSSGKPGSLLLCFVAMSRCPTMVPLLDRESALLPNIFSILTLRTASGALICSVLEFIENLLNLEDDFICQERDTIKKFLLPHLQALTLSFHSFFEHQMRNKRKSIMSPEKVGIRIFKRLVKYIDEPLAAKQFVHIMLLFFQKKSLTSDECMEVLHVIKGILPVLDKECSGEILSAVHPLLISTVLDVRLFVCDILDGLALIDPSLAFLAKLLRGLNATSALEMGEVDFDARVNTYEAITQELFISLREEHAMVILSHCVYDMSSEELILRQCASKSLLAFVRFAAMLLDNETKNNQNEEPISTGSWTKSRVMNIMKKVLLRNIGKAMGKEISVQKEWIAFLRDIVVYLPGVSMLRNLIPLHSVDPEKDFFFNILHLQRHKRAKALSRFRDVVSSGNIAEDVLKKIFIPLFFNMLVGIEDGKGEHIRYACVETLASIAAQMQWESYHAFLMRCFREVTLKPEKQKILLRLICAVLDVFHFSDSICTQESTGCKISDSVSEVELCVPTDIQSSLQNTVLPCIQKLLGSNPEKVDVNITVASLKVLKLLPKDTMESQLPTILHRVSNFLKNPLISIRDEARSALAECGKELGLARLHMVIKVLRATLKRGYELHVLGYTVNFVLSKILSHPVNGNLDYCLEELILVAENDILGDVAEEKEVEKIANKMKETRKNKSFETLTIISQWVTFKTHALKLLAPVKRVLQDHVAPKTKTKLEMMLHHIALGIGCNPSVDPTDLFVFVYGIIEDHITEENLRAASEIRIRGSQSSYLITVFALGLLHRHLKKIKLDKKDEHLLSILDPFVKLLGSCLNSKYKDILSATFKCLAPLTKLPLPSLENEADRIKMTLLDIVQKSGSTSTTFMHSCLKLLTVLLRSTRISLSDDQMRILIQFPLFIDIQTNPSFIALSLLKAIVDRKLIVHEIYDVVTQVAELMVTSQLEPIRRKCSQILMRFLLDYHLSEKRLQQHLDFLLTNLRYEHSSGRESVLEMLHVVIIKFPKTIVDSQAQTFFLHLVIALANEQDNKVCSMIDVVIKQLIGHTSLSTLQHLCNLTLQWYAGEKHHLWSPAAQVLSLLVEVLGKQFHEHVRRVLQVAKHIMASALDVAVIQEQEQSNRTVLPFWKEAYYSLSMFAKMLIHFPELYADKEIWETISKCLLHPHMWLRNISSHLLALYFKYVTDASMANQSLLLMKPSRLFPIAVSFCCQLDAQLTDTVMGESITQNLSFLIYHLHSMVEGVSINLHEFCSALDSCEQDLLYEAVALLGSREARDQLLNPTSSGQATDGDLQSLLIVSLLKRMGKIAVRREDIQMKIIFNCFQKISTKLGSGGCQKYAIQMLLPLYKVCEGFAGKVISDDIKQLAEEARQSIKEVIGQESFLQLYNTIRKNQKEKREGRKQEEKVIAAVDPMRHAKRKLRISAKRQANKKRKITTMRMGRWMR